MVVHKQQTIITEIATIVQIVEKNHVEKSPAAATVADMLIRHMIQVKVVSVLITNKTFDVSLLLLYNFYSSLWNVSQQ